MANNKWAGVGAAGGGGGTAGSLPIWSGMVPQSPLHACTDYFEAASLDPKWEEWDPAANMAVSQAGGSVSMYQPSTPADDYAGLIQPAPADDQFSVTARLRLSSRFAASSIVGAVLVGEDLSAATGSPSTGNFLVNMTTIDTAGVRWHALGYTDFSTFSTSFGYQPTPSTHVAYLRTYIDRIAGQAVFLHSADGRTWINYLAASIFPGAVPISAIDSIGIAIMNVSGQDATCFCDMFRVDVSSDMRLPIGGFPQVLL